MLCLSIALLANILLDILYFWICSLHLTLVWENFESLLLQIFFCSFLPSSSVQFCLVQLLSHVRLFATPWTAACQAFLTISNSQRLLKLMSIESVMPSNHLIFCYPFLPPGIRDHEWLGNPISSVQFSSVAQSCQTLCNPMDCSTPGLPVYQQLPEFTQIHVHWVGDAIQPPPSLLSPFPPVFNLAQNQGLFK